MTSLLKYDAACRAIAEAKSVDEVSDWIDKAAAVREYGRRIGNRQLELDAIEIRVRAKRRRGELLLALEAEGLLRRGRDEKVTGEVPLQRVTLEGLGISKNESSEEQKIAKLEGTSFERLIARCRAHAEAEKRHSFDVLKPPPSAPSATMHSRQEPDDSLDYFPTPPWATRALFEHVLRQTGRYGDIRRSSIWEPACGEGHMAEVCAEYCADVFASDVHEYGYGDVADFLDAGIDGPKLQADWIITNPPFGDKALDFVERAIALAGTGVAMFFRSQWAVEGIERYERLFKDNPPTLCAFFVERVPICKGRWDPDGSTLTAYCWLVWIKGASPRAPLWIPPGCRERLTKPDDAERFTQRPVQKRVTFDLDSQANGSIASRGTETAAEESAGASAGMKPLPSRLADGRTSDSSSSEMDGQAEAASAVSATQFDPETGEVIDEKDGLEIPKFLRREFPHPQAAD